MTNHERVMMRRHLVHYARALERMYAFGMEPVIVVGADAPRFKQACLIVLYEEGIDAGQLNAVLESARKGLLKRYPEDWEPIR